MAALLHPFDALPKLARSDADRLTAWARAAPVQTLTSQGAAAASWLGAPITVHADRPELGGDVPLDAAWPTACLAHADAVAALLLHPGIAAALIDRTLGGDGEPALATGPLTDVERGVLTYALGRWLAGSGWSVLTVLSQAAAADDALRGGRVRWPLELAIAATRGPATLLLSGEPPPPPASSRAEQLPLELSAVAGEAILPARELAALRLGDVLVPDRMDVGPAGAAWAGVVELHATGRRVGLRCRLAEGALVYEGRAPRSPSAPGRRRERAMGDERTMERWGDTPVTLTLELARFELPLADLGALSVGEVVLTGHPIGREVALRVGDRVIATGELVEVEGEVGVRVRALRE